MAISGYMTARPCTVSAGLAEQKAYPHSLVSARARGDAPWFPPPSRSFSRTPRLALAVLPARVLCCPPFTRTFAARAEPDSVDSFTASIRLGRLFATVTCRERRTL